MRLLARRPVKLVSMRDALADPAYFGELLEGESWAAWRVLLIAICGEALSDGERYTFERLTGRAREPGEPVSAFWGIIGRRGGKSRAMAVLAAFLSACVDHRPVLVRGERGVLPILAASTTQARVMFDYIAGVFAASPNLRGMIEGDTSDSLRLINGVDITIRPANHRTVRGITAIGGICDEMASWQSDDGSKNPDKEILRALRPSLASTGGPLIAISSAKGKTGALYDAFKRHYGAEGDRLHLVALAPTWAMNPSLPRSKIDEEYEHDPASAAAEYGCEWRDALSSFVDRETIEACILRGVAVRAPMPAASYIAAVDPSGGKHDSMTMAICHRDREKIVLDCIVEKRPPFSPAAVVAEFAQTLREYRVSKVVGDSFGADWPPERFREHAIVYEPAGRNRSEAFLSFLPLVNSGRVELLDNERMISQFAGLERRVAPSGRESVDHPRGSHDDVANAVALAMVEAALGAQRPMVIDDNLMRWASTPARGSLSALLGHAPPHGSKSWLPDRFIPHA